MYHNVFNTFRCCHNYFQIDITMSVIVRHYVYLITTYYITLSECAYSASDVECHCSIPVT